MTFIDWDYRSLSGGRLRTCKPPAESRGQAVAACYIPGMNAGPLFWWLRQAILVFGLLTVALLIVVFASRHAWVALWPARAEVILFQNADGPTGVSWQVLGQRNNRQSVDGEVIVIDQPWSLLGIELAGGDRLHAFLLGARGEPDGELLPVPDGWRRSHFESPGVLAEHAELRLGDESIWTQPLEGVIRFYYPNQLDASERFQILLFRIHERWASRSAVDVAASDSEAALSRNDESANG